jgi:hypothetical protein
MVTNLINDNGRAVQNQFVITETSLGKPVIAFQSYKSRVCEIRQGGMGFKRTVVLGRDWDYSNTTRKHLYKFLRDNDIDINNKKELEKALERGYFYGTDVAVWYDKTLN